jgi:hypothetical protein
MRRGRIDPLLVCEQLVAPFARELQAPFGIHIGRRVNAQI